MYQIKKLLFLLIIFLLSACYEVDMVIELNPDGSGVFKRSMNFNRATEDQKVKISVFVGKMIVNKICLGFIIKFLL